VDTTGDGYTFAAVFNQNDTTVPDPDGFIFWPFCASPPPPILAASANNCALQAAYNHATSTPWNVDFTNQYAADYTSWDSAASFKTLLSTNAGTGHYPSRIEGRSTSSADEYRARFAHGATVADADEDDVALIALYVLKVLDKKSLVRVRPEERFTFAPNQGSGRR
jgi:hypothetical protein